MHVDEVIGIAFTEMIEIPNVDIWIDTHTQIYDL